MDSVSTRGRQSFLRPPRASAATAAVRAWPRPGWASTQTGLVPVSRLTASIPVKTLFTYFRSKEDLAFADEHEFRDQLADAIGSRPAGSTQVEAVGISRRRPGGTRCGPGSPPPYRWPAASTVLSPGRRSPIRPQA